MTYVLPWFEPGRNRGFRQSITSCKYYPYSIIGFRLLNPGPLRHLLALALAAKPVRAGVDPRSSSEVLIAQRSASPLANDNPDGPDDPGLDAFAQQGQMAVNAVTLAVGVTILVVAGGVRGLIGVVLTAQHLPIRARPRKSK